MKKENTNDLNEQMRIEEDDLGQISLDHRNWYGSQTKRAMENFALSQKPTNFHLIQGIVQVKKAAAETYQKLIPEKKERYQAIIRACDQLLLGEYKDQFCIEALQGGAGTSTNMNVNEVIANLALVDLGKNKGEYHFIHPLEDVNRGQSTNDVYPTGLRIAAITLLRQLANACASLQTAFQEKENEFDGIRKLGRTELMDAVPITLGSEFGSYAQAIARDRWRIYKVEERLRQVNLGGTAVGTATTAERKYKFAVLEILRENTGIGLSAAEYPMDITQNNDVFVEVSGLLKALAVNLIKISRDLRLMNSGPNGGIGEIALAPLQMGSTIMPGKVNPVIPEMVMQVGMKVIGNDGAITMAAMEGEFELNAFLPLIADALLESLDLLVHTVELMKSVCVDKIQANKERCEQLLEESNAFATEYISSLGYTKVNQVMREQKKDPKKVLSTLESLRLEKIGKQS